MSKLKTFVVLCLLAMMLSSCSSSYYSRVDGIIPAPIETPEYLNSVLIFDRSAVKPNSFKTGNSVQSEQQLGNQSKTSRKALLDKVSLAWTKTTRVSPRFEYAVKGDRPAYKMSLAELQKIGVKQDGVLCLEQFLYLQDRSFEKYKKHQLDEKGNDYYINAVKGVRTTSLVTYWRLYDAKTGEILLEIPQVLDDVLEVDALDHNTADIKMDTTNIVTPEILAFDLAQQFGNDLNPTYIRSSWKYYKKGSPLIEQSAFFIKSERFEDAIDLLESKSFNNLTEKQRARSLYNLATAYYLSGEFNLAYETATNAYLKTNNKAFKSFLSKLSREKA